MSPLDVAIGLLALASLVLMLRNLSATGDIRVKVKTRRSSKTVYIGGSPVRPLVYVAGLPRDKPDPSLGARIASIIRQSGLNATIAFTLVRASKPDLVKRLERDIEKTRLALEATGSPRYRERLETLQRLYIDIARSTRPYTGSTALIIWAIPGQEAEARAVKTLLEAETGLQFKPFRGDPLHGLLAGESLVGTAPIVMPVPWVGEPGENSIAIGVDPEYGGLVGLQWPKDLETHVGIIGPTGRGKTVLLLGMVMQLSLPGLADRPSIIVIDPKGDLAPRVPRAVPDARPARDPESTVARACREVSVQYVGPEAAAAGGDIIAGLLDCYARSPPGHRTVLVVDEAWRYLNDDAEKYLESSVRQGRSLGLHIVYSTQSFDDISETIAENTGVLIVFGGTAESYRAKAERLGIPGDELAYLPVGSAIVRPKGRIRRVRVFNFESYIPGGGQR